MGAIRLLSLLILAVALIGGVFYVPPAANAAVAMGGRAAVMAAPAAGAMGHPTTSVPAMRPNMHGVGMPQGGLPPTGNGNMMPRVTPVMPSQVTTPGMVSPFGSAAFFNGNAFVAFPTAPVNGLVTMPLDAISFGAGTDLVPPLIVGGTPFPSSPFTTFNTAFGPAFADPRMAPFVTVGSNIVNMPAFSSPFFPPFGFPVVPTPFVSGFGAITVQ